MQTHSELHQHLLAVQNKDGGWSYGRAQSWTEPTALALLALESVDDVGQQHQRGVRWLLQRQRQDGGWSPNDAVPTSTSVTSLSLIALSKHLPSGAYSSGLGWLMHQVKPDLSVIERMRHYLQELPESEIISGGSPFYPSAGAWVAPTVMSIVAFTKAVAAGYSDPNLRLQIERGRAYLLSRRCHDGGWNHGSSQVRSAAFTSYPEMTGLGLLAFSDARQLQATLSLAKRMLHAPESAEGQAWLALGLAAHGQPASIVEWFRCRTVRDSALQLLARQTTGPTHPLFIHSL